MTHIDQPHIVGHRGLGKNPIVPVEVVAENRPDSFRLGFAAGMDGTELDMHAPAGARHWSEIVVRHDTTLPDGRLVFDCELTELRERYRLPTLPEVLAAIPPQTQGRPTLLNLEAKTGWDQEEIVGDRVDRRIAGLLAPALPKLARVYDLRVSAFDPELLIELRERGTEGSGRLAWLVERKPGFRTHSPDIHAAIRTARELRADGLHAETELFGLTTGVPAEAELTAAADVAEAVREAGLYALAWCPEPPQALALLRNGVDVCVNRLPETIRLAREVGVWRQWSAQ